jgi:tRNA(Arg) A34 adenosine deaminase TadA
MSYPEVSLALPPWVDGWLQGQETVCPDPDARMGLVIGLARQNVAHKTGGPFAAAIFERDSHRLIAPGVNIVTSAGCSVAHAEIMAIVVAQRLVGFHTLDRPGHAGYELVSSTAPCAMCLGAIPWSGVRALMCGARAEDAEAAGFDEGDKVADWCERLEQRGIRVMADVCREAAAAVITDYAAGGGAIY